MSCCRANTKTMHNTAAVASHGRIAPSGESSSSSSTTTINRASLRTAPSPHLRARESHACSIQSALTVFARDQAAPTPPKSNFPSLQATTEPHFCTCVQSRPSLHPEPLLTGGVSSSGRSIVDARRLRMRTTADHSTPSHPCLVLNTDRAAHTHTFGVCLWRMTRVYLCKL